MSISVLVPTPVEAEEFESPACELVAVLLPTYCEAENIESLIHEIQKLKLDITINVIDDSSPDGTADIARNLQKRYGNIRVVSRPRKLGLGNAITSGFRFLLKQRNAPDYIITMDADYSHNPKDIPRLLNSAIKGYDLVIGSRYIRGGEIVGWPLSRKLISRVANFVVTMVIGRKMCDCTSGFRCYSKDYIKKVLPNLHSPTYEIQIETLKQARLNGFEIQEVPITFLNRKRGKSKLSKAECKGFLDYILKTILENRRYEK